MSRGTLAMALAALMVVSVAAPAMGASSSSVESLGVDVAQTDGVTVTVTNESANRTVENATVDVATVDENASYAGTGTYTTDSDGTAGLPTPDETVTVSVTASYEGLTANSTVELTVGNETAQPFGLQLQNFIAGLDNTEGPRGLTIAQWVTENNPGNGNGPPAWAGPGNETGNETRGPPDHAGNDSENKTQGPPDHAGNDSENKTQGPPDHAGNDSGNETESNGNGNGGGNGNGNNGNGNGNGDGNGNNGNGNGKAKDR